MKLSISNIAWTSENDQAVYETMKKTGFDGLEIAPTRIFPEAPYDKCNEARKWAGELKDRFGFEVPSMQSIWYGRQEKLFGDDGEREALTDYTKRAIDFAKAVGCRNLVFGCPRNRQLSEGTDENLAIEFFRQIGDYAFEQGTAIGMEANPPIYNTNYINDTKAALELIEKVDSKGFLLNLDVGTMIENDESVELLNGRAAMINHVHISEPGLKPIEKRAIHKELAKFLSEAGYDRYVSIEVGRQDDLSTVTNMMQYVKELFA